MNNCNFIGRAGKDAETRYTQGGQPVTAWSLAVDTGWGDKKKTIWLDCSYWGERGAKVAEYIRKGGQLGVTGEIGAREHDGRTYITLNVQNVTLIGGRNDDAPRQQRQQRQSTPAQRADDFNDDDIPF